MQSSDQSKNLFAKTVNKYSDLIKTVARIEYSRLAFSQHIIEMSDLVNIGATAVYIIVSSQPKVEPNYAYLATAIKWAIRNEFRKRYKWYSCKHLSKEYENEKCEENDELNRSNVREAIYETIFSLEELSESDNPVQIVDTADTPERRAEFLEICKAIRDSIKELPAREKIILEMRFYDNKRVKQIAAELDLTSSRVSKIIQIGLDKIKAKLKNNNLL